MLRFSVYTSEVNFLLFTLFKLSLVLFIHLKILIVFLLFFFLLLIVLLFFGIFKKLSQYRETLNLFKVFELKFKSKRVNQTSILSFLEG